MTLTLENQPSLFCVIMDKLSIGDAIALALSAEIMLLIKSSNTNVTTIGNIKRFMPNR